MWNNQKAFEQQMIRNHAVDSFYQSGLQKLLLLSCAHEEQEGTASKKGGAGESFMACP
jgi:hypothetical protein